MTRYLARGLRRLLHRANNPTRDAVIKSQHPHCFPSPETQAPASTICCIHILLYSMI